MKLKKLVSKSIIAIDRISQLDQLGGNLRYTDRSTVSGALGAAEGAFKEAADNLSEQLNDFGRDLNIQNEEVRRKFKEDVEDEGSRLLTVLTGIAATLGNTLKTLQGAAGENAARLADDLTETLQDTLQVIVESVNVLRNEISTRQVRDDTEYIRQVRGGGELIPIEFSGGNDDRHCQGPGNPCGLKDDDEEEEAEAVEELVSMEFFGGSYA